MAASLNHRLHGLETPACRQAGIILISLFILCVIWFPSGAFCADTIRVAIVQDADSFNMRVKGDYEITNSSGGMILARGKEILTAVTATKERIFIDGQSFDTSNIFIRTTNPDEVIVNGRIFRGNIELIKDRKNKLTVVNFVELEDYLRGILYHEVSHYWPMESLKAQAIVSRTYVLYQRKQNSEKDFDVTSDVYSQVYGGATSERYRTGQAVDATKGQVLTSRGEVFPAYFHAACGGHTEDASLLWNIDLEPLKGVACSFCKESPHFNWHYVLSLGELEDALSASGRKAGRITQIDIMGRDGSGRVTELRFLAGSEPLRISAKELRNIIGPNIIRSTNFSVNIAGRDVVFEGFGWGHGVGMCQWGAYFMSKNGSSFQQILKYYYPGANIETL